MFSTKKKEKKNQPERDLIATFRFDYEYEIEYEYEFSNQIRVPHIINYHRVRGIQLSRNSKVVLVLDFVLVVKSKGR